MIASRVTPFAEEEEIEVDGAKGVGGATNLDCLERSYVLLCLTAAASTSHIAWK